MTCLLQSTESVKPTLTAAAVAEILRTERGTTFYVLTVAGDHGVPEDAEGETKEKEAGDKDDEEPPANGGAFVTEAPPAEGKGEAEVVEESKPEYISCVDIPLSNIVEAKKA